MRINKKTALAVMVCLRTAGRQCTGGPDHPDGHLVSYSFDTDDLGF
jgi:hypothetical protein